MKIIAAILLCQLIWLSGTVFPSGPVGCGFKSQLVPKIIVTLTDHTVPSDKDFSADEGLLYVQQPSACRLKNPHVWYNSVHEDAVTSHCSLSLVAVCFMHV